ncbi:nucleoside triphosphate pyrophosphohydrolase [Chloroflexota bacterium]
MEVPEDLRKFETLVEIIARLRAPDGCPWDRKQTHTSLRPNMLEEAYEALAALDEGNAAKLCEELGDVMLQIALHSQIASETGEFEMGDVIEGINKKLIYRHPHIFGSTKAENAEEVAHNWEALKREERGEDVSMLASVPEQMPALGYSQSIQKRVAQAGFDWEDISGVIDKLAEEVAEYNESTGDEKAEEFGDLLFTLVNVGRRMGIDSEAALRGANKKFYLRFSTMEDICRQRGVSFADLSFEEQNKLWEEAKKLTGS